MNNTNIAVAPTEMGVTAGLLPLAVIIFLGFSTIGIPLPALPLEVTQSLGFGAVTVGWVIGTQSLVTVFSRQLAGRIADARGPKLAVLIGLPLATITGCFYFASTLVADANVSLVLLLIGRVLLGLSESFVLTGAMTWGIARLGVNRAARVMAWQGIAMFGALSIGGPVGAWLMEAWGFRSIAIATMALPLLGLGVAFALPAAQMAAGKREGFFKVVGLIWRHGLALLLGATPYATVISFTTLYFLAHDWAGAGYALAGFGLGYIVVRIFFIHLLDRAGALLAGAGSLSVEVIGMLLLAVAPNGIVALIGATLTGVGFSLVFPSIGAEAVRKVTPQDRGSAVSAFSAFLDIALGLTGPVMGVLLSLGGFPLIYVAGAVAAVAAIALVLALRRG